MKKVSVEFSITEIELASLRKLKKTQVYLRIFMIFAIYALCTIVLMIPNFKYMGIFLCPFMGFILSGFLNAAHDCIHCTHFGSRKANRIIGMFWCLPIFVNYTIYRYQHLTHHRYTGVNGDTETRKEFTSVKSYFYSLTGIDYWLYILKMSIKSAQGNFPASINTEKRRNDVIYDNYALALWLLIIIIVTIIFPIAMLFIYWFPLLFYAPFAILITLPEHYGCMAGPDLKYNTRSILTNRIIRFFLWNGNYHAEHHIYPGISATNMRYLHKKMLGEVHNYEKSYMLFHWKLLKKLLKIN